MQCRFVQFRDVHALKRVMTRMSIFYLVTMKVLIVPVRNHKTVSTTRRMMRQPRELLLHSIKKKVKIIGLVTELSKTLVIMYQCDFAGIVYGADADADNKGFRLFLVYYFDDPGSFSGK